MKKKIDWIDVAATCVGVMCVALYLLLHVSMFWKEALLFGALVSFLTVLLAHRKIIKRILELYWKLAFDPLPGIAMIIIIVILVLEIVLFALNSKWVEASFSFLVIAVLLALIWRILKQEEEKKQKN